MPEPPAPQPPTPRTVLVTGGSAGIGAASVRAFLAQGDRVAALSRSGRAPQGAMGVMADVTDRQAVRAAVKEVEAGLGPVQVLVSCAGRSDQALAVRTRPEAWDRLVDTNLTGSFHAVEAVLPGMLRAHWGRVVLVSSVIAARGGVGLAAYGASKGGIEGLTRSLAREVAGRGVTVNAVAPGLIDTAMTADLADRVRETYLSAIPVGRTGRAEEVAAAVTFLASQGASYVCGAVLGVDGGMGMGR